MTDVPASSLAHPTSTHLGNEPGSSHLATAMYMYVFQTYLHLDSSPTQSTTRSQVDVFPRKATLSSISGLNHSPTQPDTTPLGPCRQTYLHTCSLTHHITPTPLYGHQCRSPRHLSFAHAQLSAPRTLSTCPVLCVCVKLIKIITSHPDAAYQRGGHRIRERQRPRAERACWLVQEWAGLG